MIKIVYDVKLLTKRGRRHDMSSFKQVKREKEELELKIYYDIMKFEDKHNVKISKVTSVTDKDIGNVQEVLLKLEI